MWIALTSTVVDSPWLCYIVSSSAASLTIILGYYGSVSLELGPNCSRLVQPNPLFVQSLKVIFFFFVFLFDFTAAIIGSADLIRFVEQAGELGKPKPGPILYGFYKPPPLDVEITWTQKHDAVVPKDFHKANLSLFL